MTEKVVQGFAFANLVEYDWNLVSQTPGDKELWVTGFRRGQTLALDAESFFHETARQGNKHILCDFSVLGMVVVNFQAFMWLP